jgi:hypothetical protein
LRGRQFDKIGFGSATGPFHVTHWIWPGCGA